MCVCVCEVANWAEAGRVWKGERQAAPLSQSQRRPASVLRLSCAHLRVAVFCSAAGLLCLVSSGPAGQGETMPTSWEEAVAKREKRDAAKENATLCGRRKSPGCVFTKMSFRLQEKVSGWDCAMPGDRVYSRVGSQAALLTLRCLFHTSR